MTGVVVGELLLARALEAVVELLAQAGAQLVHQRTGVEPGIGPTDAAEEQADVPEVRLHRVRDARVLHLDRDGTAVARDGAVHLSDRRCRDRLGIELGEDPIGRRAELALDRLGGQLDAHRRCVLLELGERGAHVLGESLVEVADHLAELHQRALHLAELAGDVLGVPELDAAIERARGVRPRRTGPAPWRPSAGRRRVHPSRASRALRARRVLPTHRSAGRVVAPGAGDGQTGEGAERETDDHPAPHDAPLPPLGCCEPAPVRALRRQGRYAPTARRCGVGVG